MGRFITLLLVIIAAIAGFFMYKQQDVGFLAVTFADFKFETTLLKAGSALLISAFVLLILFKIFGLLHKVVLYFGSQRKTRLVEKARNALSLGLIELAEGRFEEAEKLLLKQLKHSDNALLAYLAAARAAQQLGEHERRDDYLRKAHEITPTAEVAIGLTKAELQIAHEQYEQALANLSHLHALAPKHAYVIKLLLKTYRQLADWKNIQTLLPDIKNHQLLDKADLLNLELEIWNGLLTEQAHCNDLTSLSSLWSSIPETLKAHTQLVECYSDLLETFDATNQAERILRDHLQSNWSESSIILYSKLNVVINNQEIEQVESWLKEHQHNAYLLLALGKICFNKQLWGKARSYLDASLSTQAMPETYLQLAQLLESHMDETDLAQQNYRLGLECLAGGINAKTNKTQQDDDTIPDLKVVQ